MSTDQRSATFEPQVCTPAQFARAVGTGSNRVYEYVRQGRVRHLRHGNRIVIPISEIQRFIDTATSEAV